MTTSRNKRRQQVSPLSAEEVSRLLAIPNPRRGSGLRNRAILETMLRAGLRVSEVCDLRACDVRLAATAADTGWIEIRHSKRDGSRNIPIGPRLAEWLTRWTAARPDSEWYFCTVRGYNRTPAPEGSAPVGQQLIERNVWDFVHKYAIRAGLEEDALRRQMMNGGERVEWRVHPHLLRHTFATNVLDYGVRGDQLQVLMGHADIRTTMLYVHPRSRDLADLAEKYG